MRKVTTAHVPLIDEGKHDAMRAGARHLSLGDRAYETIKQWIITCKFQPGEIIDEISVSNLIGFGRTPVHQAFSRLNFEGLVDVIPRKGVIVTPIVFGQVMQLAEARIVNETQTIRLAAERIDGAELKRLNEILKGAQRAIRARDVEAMMKHDHEFHLTLARASRNEYLTNIICNLNERSLRFWFISFTTDHHPQFQRQHEDIVDALAARNPDGAEKAMRRHLETFRLSLEAQLNK